MKMTNRKSVWHLPWAILTTIAVGFSLSVYGEGFSQFPDSTVTNWNGEVSSFRVSYTNVNGYPITYSWTLDGNPIAGSSSTEYDTTWTLAQAGLHTIVCTLSSGGDVVNVATWNVTVKRRLYVDASSTASSPTGADRTSAFGNIYNAFENSQDGDVIWVLPGSYYGFYPYNENRIVVVAAEGVEKTTISSEYEYDPVCVYGYDTNLTTVVGFTLSGSGAMYATLRNCVITGCVARSDYYYGGYSCFEGARLENCLVTHNQGACLFQSATLLNCTVVDNDVVEIQDMYYYGGMPLGVIGPYTYVYNSIVRFNYDEDGYEANIADVSSTWGASAQPRIYYSCIYPQPTVGSNNVTSDPCFADALFGDYRLYTGSPCIDAGNCAYVSFDMDYAGSNRVVGASVDMGCYEGAVTLPAPVTPTGVSVGNGVAAEGVIVTWDAMPGAKQYVVYRAENNDASIAVIVATVEHSKYEDLNTIVGARYWYFIKAMNDSGESGISAGESGYRVHSLSILTTNLYPVVAGMPFETQLIATGGVPSYAWSPCTNFYDYAKMTSPSTFTNASSIGIGLNSSSSNLMEYKLPFEFPFGGVKYDSLYISSYGAVVFGERPSYFYPEEFRNYRVIAPLLGYSGDYGDVYLDKSDAHEITFRWKYESSDYYYYYKSHFSLTLTDRGDIRMAYGDGNENGGFVGLSFGDGVHYLYETLRNAPDKSNDILFNPNTLPVGISIDVDGRIEGRLSDVGEYRFKTTVEDSLGNRKEDTITLAVVENPNLHPVATNFLPLASTVLVRPDADNVFKVEAFDPEGLPLTWTWLIDGVTNCVTTTPEFNYHPDELFGGAHTLTCIVSDGFWHDRVDKRRTIVVPKWYVAPTGSSSNSGNCFSNAFASIQTAIDRADAGDVIYVASGIYSPVSTGNKSITILSAHDALAVIDGSGKSRCVNVGSGASLTNTVFCGFTICNGYVAGDGAGALGGTFKNCIIHDCRTANGTYYGGGAAYGTLYNCQINDNQSDWEGGGAYSSTLYNCTVVGNRSPRNPGVSGGTCHNTIAWDNMLDDCRTRAGNDGENPLLVVDKDGIYRLSEYSPCLDAGTVSYEPTALDLIGSSRIQGATIDRGATEGCVPGLCVQTVADGAGSISSAVAVESGRSVVLEAVQIEDEHRFLGFYDDGVLLEGDSVSGLVHHVTFFPTANVSTVTARFEKRTFLVSPSGDDTQDARTWDTARRTISAALRSARSGDEVLVADGRYEGFARTDNQAVTIRSVNGAFHTVIDGGGTNACAVLGARSTSVNMVLQGFTLMNGRADNGGGVSYGTVRNCIFKDNVAASNGGGSFYSVIENSIFWRNTAQSGGGASGGTLFNCTIYGNATSRFGWQGYGGAGTSGATVYNSILVGNKPDNAYNGALNSCFTVGDPQFVHPEDGDFRLREGSPCIDAGSDGFARGSTDVAGNMRTQGERIDLGAYEGPTHVIVVDTRVIGHGSISPRYALLQDGDDAHFVAVAADRPFLGFSTNGVDIVETSTNFVWRNATADGIVCVHYATNIYVNSVTGDDQFDGFTPESSLKTLQAAAMLARDGETICVANGVYEFVNTFNKAIRFVSEGGFAKTIIDGYGTNRCVYVGESDQSTKSAFVGFTLRNGFVVGNAGGGASGGSFDCCVIENCQAQGGTGGGTYYSVLNNCLLKGNNAHNGGAAAYGSLVNCTVVGNSASQYGGGTYYGSIQNSIVWANDTQNSSSNYYYGTVSYSCVAPTASGTGNVSENPYFTDVAGGDYRLRQYSPCLDVGNNSYVVGNEDLSGTNRVVDGRVDMGCYEGWVYLPEPTAIGGFSAEDGRRIGLVRLTWEADEYARSYTIYRAETNIVDAFEMLSSTASCFYDDDTAIPGVTYWYRVVGVNPTGIGPISEMDSGWCLGEMTFAANALETAIAGLPYSAHLSISGGAGGYVWKSGADDYDVVYGDSTYLVDDCGTAGVSGDDVCLSYPLPFDFPFFGRAYNKVWVNSNGTLTFDGEYNGYAAALSPFTNRVMIAAFWKDLRTGSGGVGVSTNGGDSITFLWNNASYYSGGAAVNASVTLYSDGTVLCSYGSGNASGAFVGVSAGDGVHFRYVNLVGTSLANYDDIRFVPQDVPGGLALAADGTLSGIAAAPGTYTFTVFVTDSYGNGATQKITLEVETNPNLRTVQFDLGTYGVHGGGGNLLQYVMLGEDAAAPTVRSCAGWVFDGWNRPFTNISENISVSAKYRSAYADLHVDAIDVANVVASGESLDLRWILGNTGNPSFNGRMTERISLVSASDENDVRVIASPTFEGAVERDGSIERNLAIDVPLKGWEGTWHVRIQTAINPTMQEYAANNVTTTVERVEITAVPLPNLKANAVSGDANLVPGESALFSFATTNSGAAAAFAPWMDCIYLESVDSGIAVKVGDVSRTNDLDSTSAINGGYALTIPEFISVAGAVRVKVVADANGDVVEVDDDDNVACSVGTFSLATNLYLTVASTSVYENGSGSGVRFIVKRSGPTTEELIVALSVTLGGSSSSATVNCPESVTIPAGSVSTVFYVKPIDNATVEGSRTVTVSASAGDCRPASLALTILDNEVPKLTVTLDKTSIREGDGVILATVTRELVTDEPLTVYITCASTSRCSYPSFVVIPAGEASVTFEISVPNNDTAQAAASLTLRASSSGYTPTSVSYTVEDDDVPGVTLSLTPEVVSEGAGAQAIYATLARSDTNQIAQAVRVRLTASEVNQLILPSEITIPKYTMAVRFAVGVVDNALDDGDREIDIDGAIVIESCGCNGQSSNGDVIHATVGIIDNNGPALALRADPTTMKEGFDPAGYLVFSHNSTLMEDLTVRLWVDAENEDEIVIPETVTIPAGETSVRIPVATLDDGVEDGGQLVSVYVEDESGVFAPASAWVQVSDQNLPDLTVAKVEKVASVVAMENFNVSFAVTNTGFMATSKAVPYAVHLVKGANANAISSATLVKSGTLTGGIGVGAALNGTVTLTAPEMPGDYRVAVVVDPDGTILELDEANNTSWCGPIQINPAYVASVWPEKAIYFQGEKVGLSGIAVAADGITPKTNVELELYVLNAPYRRTYTVRTDSQGRFDFIFEPLKGEAGHYEVGASCPGVFSVLTSGSFDIAGLSMSNAQTLKFDLVTGESGTLEVPLKNLSSVSLNDLSVVLLDVPAEFRVSATISESVSGYGYATMTIAAEALSTTVDRQNGFGDCKARVVSADGEIGEYTIYFRAEDPKPSIAFSFSPAAIVANMTVGETRYVEAVLKNDGMDASEVIEIMQPSVPWMKVISQNPIESLGPGETTTVIVELAPTHNLALNAPITGDIVARSDTGNSAKLALKLTPVSSSVGSITVMPTDEYTYYHPQAPHVSNAVITVTNPHTGALMENGMTNEDGLWHSGNLPAGVYTVSVSADKHSSWSGNVSIEPEEEKVIEPFITYTTVTYTWKVEKTEIEDNYTVTMLADFVTSVPKPTIEITVPNEIPDLNEGESYTFNAVFVNHGLVSAYNVRPCFSEDFPYTYEFLVPDISEIPAKSSVCVPVRIVNPARMPLLQSVRAQKSTRDYVPDPIMREARPCTTALMAIFDHYCGGQAVKQASRSNNIMLAGAICDTLAIIGRVIADMLPTLSTGDGGFVTGPGGYENVSPSINIPDSVEIDQEWLKEHCRRGISILNGFLDFSLFGNLPFANTSGALCSGGDWGAGNTGDAPLIFLGDMADAANMILGTEGIRPVPEPPSLDPPDNPDESGDNSDFWDVVDSLPLPDDEEHPIQNELMGMIQNEGLQTILDETIFYQGPNRRQQMKSLLQANVDISTSDYYQLLFDQKFEPEIQKDVAILVTFAQYMNAWSERLFHVLGGAECWLQDSRVHQFESMVLAMAERARMRNGLSGMNLAEFDGFEVCYLHRYREINPGISIDQIDAFIARWNRTVAYYNAGKFNPADLGTGDSDDFIDLDTLNRLNEDIIKFFDRLVYLGYDNPTEAVNAALEHIRSYTNIHRDEVCARVSLKLSQNIAIAREAFKGTLSMTNGHDSEPITDIQLHLAVTDSNGVICNDRFGISENGLETMTGDSIVAGGVQLAALKSGSATILFVPTYDAAPEKATTYYFGGTLTYHDPYTSERITVTLTPVPLVVNPCPKLALHYFLQQEVFADDPFTSEVVESSEAAEFALMVVNSGCGTVQNMKVSAAQPEQLVNAKGLKVDFELKDYRMQGVKVNGSQADSFLETDIGTIAPNATAQAQWWLFSTIQGRFTGMRASFTHCDDFGNPKTSLVDETKLHALVRSVMVDDSGLSAFLTDEAGANAGPDTLYLPNGTFENVARYIGRTENLSFAGGIGTATIRFDAKSDGPFYICVDDPGNGNWMIEKVVRSDGTELPIRNVWLRDRSIAENGTATYAHKLHVFDRFANAGQNTYTVHFKANDAMGPCVVAFSGIENHSVVNAMPESVFVQFDRGVDLESVDSSDVRVVWQGESIKDVSELTFEAFSGNKTIKIGNLSCLGGKFGTYELTVFTEGILDESGCAGINGKSVAWTYATADAPYVIGADGVPVRRVQSLDAISVTFSVPIEPTTFTSAALRMNDAPVAGVTIAPLDATGTRFSVSGLSAAQASDGEYALTVDASAISGLDGTHGVNTYLATWTRDTVAPVLQSLTHADGFSGNEFTLAFSEEVESESLTSDRATLKRNGSVVALPGTAQLRRLGTAAISNSATGGSPSPATDGENVRYVLSGIDSVLAEDGTYELSFSSDGVTDEAGNVASGGKSVSWTVDRTPPTQITDLAISPDGGFSDTDGITYTGALTVSGTLPETDLTVDIIAKYVGGGETVLATLPAAGGDSLPAGAFSQNIDMHGTGNATLVVRLTDAAGNSSDSEKSVSVDGIALTGTLTGASDDEGVVTTTATLAFSAKPMESDVTFDKFALTRDGEAVALEGATFAKVDDATFTLSGLDSFCAEDGVYVLTFNGAMVRKYTSGLTMGGSLVMRWRYENPDREPPTVTAVRFDGETPHETYTNGLLFSSVSVMFSEAVNVPELIENGLIQRAARIDLLDVANSVTGSAVIASAMTWDGESNTLSWQIDPLSVPAGGARLILDAGLIADLAGNYLAADGYASTNGMRTYTLSETVLANVNAQAMPTWYSGELYVGEKTADNKGKIRHYAANGTWAYLQSGGVDIEIPAQGCQGASVAFADMDGDGAVETYVGTATGDVLKYPGGTAIASLGANRAMPYAYDIDGDGCDELVVGGMDGRIRVISRDAMTGAHSMAVLTDVNGAALTVPNGRAAPIVADINNDGLADIVSGDTAGNVWAYLGERRDGGIAPYQGGDQGLAALPCCATPICVFTNDVGLADRSRLGYGDVNGDEIEDLIVGRSDGSVTVMLGAETASPIVPFAVKAVVSASAGAHGAIVPVGDTTYDGGDTPEYVITAHVGYHVADVLVDGVSIGVTNSYVFAPLTTSHTINADFAPTAYAITYTGLKGASNPNPATYTVEDAVTFAAPGEVYGWVFTGWTPASIALGSTGAIEVTANWERAKFDVTVNGETRQYDYEEEVTFTAPEPIVDELCKTQFVYVGTSYTAPVVTNEFTVMVTNGFEFAWDVLATNYWFETDETQNGSITAPEAGWMSDGTNFTLVAVPAEHYHFVGWTGDTNECAVADGALEVAMDQARTIGATFAIDMFTVTFEAGAHGALSGETAQTIDYGGTAAVPEVTPDAGYSFTGWSGDTAASIVSNATFTAQYAAIPYAITYTGLKGAANPNPATYTVEDAVTFAIPGEVYGWVFKGWTPASIARGSTGVIEVTANWERAKFDVTVNGETRQYSYEDEVTFTAPEPTVDELCRTQFVYVGTSYTAPTVTNEFTVSITTGFEFAWDILATNYWFEAVETQNGSITAPEAGWKPDGDEFTLAAVPAEHYHFTGWTGDTEGCVETNDVELVVTMDEARTIGATFAIDTFAVTFEAGAHGALSGETAQTIDYGGVAVVPTVTPDVGYRFTGWSGDVSVPIVGNVTFTAQYAAVPYTITYTGLRGASNTNPETYTVEDAITFAAPGEVYGWVFKGWTPASIALGSTGAIEVTANWERQKFDVTVNGETRQYDYEEMVTLTTNAVVNCGATQYVCKGWTAANADPESGEGARAEFRVFGDVALDWQWETNVVTLARSVNADSFDWATGGAADWWPEWSDDAADNVHQARCGMIPNGTNAYLAATVEGPGALTFKWRSSLASRNTKYQLLVDGEVKGMLTGTNGWTAASVTVFGDRTHELKWRLSTGRSGASAGDVVALDEVAWSPAVPPSLAEALNTNLVWTTDGEGTWRGEARESLTDSRDARAVVSRLGDNETAAIQTRVYGSGILSFDWAISCEEDYDWMELTVDGEVCDYVSGNVGWMQSAVEIVGDGWHVVRWEYIKDEMDDPELAGDNVAKLDNVVWTSDDAPPAATETQTTPVPVPYVELEGRFSAYLEQAKGDYEAAAKLTGRNGHAIWESYVAGLEPDNADSKFRAKIEMVDGKPVIRWDPDTPELRATRIYTTYGKKTLIDAQWTPVTDDNRAEFNFFKVEVRLKQ